MRTIPSLLGSRWLLLLGATIGAASLVASHAVADPDASPPHGSRSDAELVRLAVDADERVASGAVAALRARGPSAHRALFDAHRAEVARLQSGITSPELERLRRALDGVSAQRDAHATELFWHTDLDAAKAEARSRRVPILSLRLLGRLDEELSCANSRYFRTVLYPTVAQALRERFVLHWSSERPAPRITIDMGDGRTMTRTITGNSVHYVLDAEGRVVDALPGLYAPTQLTAALDRARAIVDGCARARNELACRARRHREALETTRIAWERRREANPTLPTLDALLASLDPNAALDAPSALLAMPLTIGKAAIEVPMLDAMARRRTPPPPDTVEWASLVGPIELPSPQVRALVRLKTGRDDGDTLAFALTRTAVIDGLRNETLLHSRVHRWLGDEARSTELAAFNPLVYAELFLTPANDPWLGLRDPDVWDAIEEAR
jgi:hypothetical protein